MKSLSPGVFSRAVRGKTTGCLRCWITLGKTITKSLNKSLGNAMPTGAFEELQDITGNLRRPCACYGCASDQGCVRAQVGVRGACALPSGSP